MIVLVAMTWVTLASLAAESRAALAQADTRRQERARLALWRMDAVVAQLIAVESARPYFHYWPRYDPSAPYDRVWAGDPRAATALSPLATGEATPAVDPVIVLHFQIEPDGEARSPTAASDDGLVSPDAMRAERTLERLRGKLVELRPMGMMSRFIAGESAAADLNLRQSVVNVGPQYAGSVEVGVFTPRWIESDEEMYVAFVRPLDVAGRLYAQGFVAPWTALRGRLLGAIADIAPSAKLIPEAGDSERIARLALLDVELSMPEAGVEEVSLGLTPLRRTLALAWIAAGAAGMALSVAQRAAARVARRRAAFVAAVAHELRTPLTAIRLHADLLASGATEDERAAARTIGMEAARLSGIVENVLATASGRRHSNGEASTTGLAEVERRLRRLGGEDVEVVFNADRGGSIAVAGSDVDLVVGNLLANARTHGRAPIRVEAWMEGDVFRVRVSDNGPGISDADRARVFEAFERGGGAENAPGLGVGLWLARETALANGGDVVIEPRAEDGRGARVVASFPLLEGVEARQDSRTG
ncbi:MAG: hypothetical protein CMJ31_06820 [Phycisphaerae bacterium]|nr:hypothetical protein [Phycisphaerae bacterium]